MARLAISKGFLTEYARLDKPVQRAVDQAIATFARDPHPGQRLSLNYRTTQEILAWAVPLPGTDPVTGLDGEVDSLIGYRSPMHGPRPQQRLAVTRAEEFNFLAERIGAWLSDGIEPHAVGVAARSAALVREAREALRVAVTTEAEDAATHAQDLQRERCVLFVACTRARDHLYVSGTGHPSIFLPP